MLETFGAANIVVVLIVLTKIVAAAVVVRTCMPKRSFIKSLGREASSSKKLPV